MTVSRGKALGKCLDHDGGTLMTGISALIKETPESSSLLLPSDDTVRKWLSLSWEAGSHQTPLTSHILILDFLAYRNK